jgi:predicted TIM-barrel fold metal-dependent hydrolase
MTGQEEMEELKIIDAHHHFWDPDLNYYPWLRDEPMIPFRYGDYSSLKKPFMPDDYFAAAKGHKVVKTVTMEGEWDPSDPAGETTWIQAVAAEHGVPHAHASPRPGWTLKMSQRYWRPRRTLRW